MHQSPNSQSLTVADIREKNTYRLKTRLKHVVTRETNTTVTGIYVMGSLAAGNGTRNESDLDIRVVTNGMVPVNQQERIHELFKNEHSDVTPPCCTHLDVHVTGLQPDQDTPHEQI